VCACMCVHIFVNPVLNKVCLCTSHTAALHECASNMKPLVEQISLLQCLWLSGFNPIAKPLEEDLLCVATSLYEKL